MTSLLISVTEKEEVRLALGGISDCTHPGQLLIQAGTTGAKEDEAGSWQLWRLELWIGCEHQLLLPELILDLALLFWRLSSEGEL